MKIGGKYNWRNQADRLIYLGKKGGWHQFKKIGDSRDVWCEVLTEDLHRLEETPEPEQPAVGNADFVESVGLMLAAIGYTEEYARQWPQEKVSITFKRWFDEQIAAAKNSAQSAAPAEPTEPTSILGVAVVVEELENTGDGFQARVRWLFNPVPVGETLLWDHGTTNHPSKDVDSRDAERYRFLRRGPEASYGEFYIGVDSDKFDNRWALQACEADAAIDAAIAKDATP